MKKNARIRACALLAALALLCAAAASADGYSYSSHGSGQFNYAQSMEYRPWGYSDAQAYSQSKYVRVISKSASIWQEPRTNSKKLGSASNGDNIEIIRGDNGGPLTQGDFYRVSFKGKAGWINKAYCVYAPLEIVLMESNVPAYCAPDTASKKVGSLSKLTRYTVLGTFGDFYIVNLRQAAAFIPMDVLHYDTNFESYYLPADLNNKNGRVLTKTTLRTGPGDWYASVQELKPGDQFTCVDEIDGWFVVAYQSKSTDGVVLLYLNSYDAEAQFYFEKGNG